MLLTFSILQVTLVIFASVLACVIARPQSQERYNSYDAAEPAKYDFSWNVNTVDYNQNELKYGQNESRDGAYVKGSYYILLPDTRLMRVDYYADATGFHPTYTFEGTAKYPDPPAQGYRG